MSEHHPIHQWPEAERPRERLLEHGAARLSDAELLALLIGSGTRGRSAVEVARLLLAACGDLRGVLDRHRGDLPRGLGIGAARWAVLQASAELGRRAQAAALRRGTAIAEPADVQRAFRARLRDAEHEVFSAMFLDARHQVIGVEDLFHGSLTGAAVYVGVVVKRALKLGAAALVVAHNHPSGIAEPSHADRELTERLRQALALVEIRLLDHVIVGDADSLSFAERGWL
ncbi:MAG: DNA repair protein RadC [Rhodanobacteraceae bacterium]|nr:DNA repair protein RadC [Rhodanobacteraceae bacterium]